MEQNDQEILLGQLDSTSHVHQFLPLDGYAVYFSPRPTLH